jgi:hypothetical protein
MFSSDIRRDSLIHAIRLFIVKARVITTIDLVWGHAVVVVAMDQNLLEWLPWMKSG